LTDERLADAFKVHDADPDLARELCNDLLREDPTNAAALFLIGTMLAKCERYGESIAMFERCTKLAPRREEAWNNLGMAYQECGQRVEAKECFKRALDLNSKPAYMANLATTFLTEGNYVEAKRWCKKALAIEPQDKSAWTTLGFAALATGDWELGWKGYSYCLGGRFRQEVKIGDEPKWDGSPVERLFIYGEQGLGDEIMYASCIEDAKKHAKSITLECDPRLEGLFRRSFPDVEVYGSRRQEAPAWVQGRAFDAGVAVGELPRLYRPTRDSCPRKPYLVADPERRIQWKALFESWGKRPVIGLCWSGGRHNTQKKERLVGLEAFRPLIESMDAHFVSLQYTDATKEIEATGLPVKHIHRAVQSPDYDDTASFVAECDLVIGVHTSVHHLAGALGVPSVVLVPQRPMWNYATGDGLPWYESQPYFRQRVSEDWPVTVRRLVDSGKVQEALG
jgi:hypothetical protein